jgi:aryl-alcohol dehydrogenase-like predicted oxidoreductase
LVFSFYLYQSKFELKIMSKKLGSTNLYTPTIVFGGNVFGWTVNEKESFELLDRLMEMGIDMIDSADVYSRWAPGNSGGESETILGNYMQSRKNRHKFKIITKVGSNMVPGEPKDISKTHILKAVEDSLKRLQTDYIDLYFTHKDDGKTPVEETLEAYDKLIKQGKVRYIGASNLSASRLEDSLKAAEKSSLPKYEVFQPEYNLVVREQFEGDIQNLCEKYELGVISYFSLASGFLTGKYPDVDSIKGNDREQFLNAYFTPKGKQILPLLKEISRNKNISQAAVALRWLLQKPHISAPIASATSFEQLKSFEQAINTPLSDEEMKMLDNAGE